MASIRENGRILVFCATARRADAAVVRLLDAARDETHEIDFARSLDETRDRIVARRPDLFVLDAGGDDSFGLAACIEAVKALSPRLAVLVVSRDVTPQIAHEATRAGALDCLDLARIDAYALRRILSYVLRGARTEKALASIEDHYRSVWQQLSFAETHDALTKLVNRRVLEREISQAMEDAAAGGTVHALCYLDLDQFKIVNDTWSHEAGDDLLRRLSAFIAARVAKQDTFARLGGDEFALLLRGRDLDEAARAAEELLDAIRGFRFEWGARTFDVRASIGVVAIDGETAALGDVLGAADAACYAAKEKGRDQVYVKEPNDKTVKRRISEMHLVVEAKHALNENRMRLYQQPILPVRAADAGELRFEVLIRMLDWDGEIVPPGVFLPAMERYNMSRKVDRWVLNTFLRWMNARPELLSRLAHASINVSGMSIGDRTFLDAVCAMLDEHDIAGEKLCFEITETAAVQNLAGAQGFIATLKRRGCRFALDDFGSGLSSFGYLKNLPVDFVKIDGMFVSGMRASQTDRVIVRAINDVAHSMGLLTIAEFVEDAETLRIAAELGVDYAQGYGIGHPAPIENLRASAPAEAARFRSA